MTTATTDALLAEAQTNQAQPGSVSLPAGEQPKRRRGRPPGSKNKTKTTRTTRAAAPRAPRTSSVKTSDMAKLVLIESVDGGTRFTFFDEKGKAAVDRTVNSEWIFDRRN
jgi:hypothetical protein